jgi:hypothetical protein
MSRDDSRKTGDPQTSVMNSIINALVTIFVILKILEEQGFEYDLFDLPFYLVVQGDDILVGTYTIIEKWLSAPAEGHINLYVKYWTEFGFKLKFYTASCNLEDLDYCSRYFYPTSNGYVLAPKPGKVLYKSGWAKNKPIHSLVQLRGNALGLLADSSVVPFLRKYVECILNATSNIEADVISNPWSIHNSKRSSPTAETWDFFYQKYGLTEADELDFSRMLSQIKSFPWHVENTYVQTMAKVDHQ